MAKTLQTLLDDLATWLDESVDSYTEEVRALALHRAAQEWAVERAAQADRSEAARVDLAFLMPPAIEGRGSQIKLNGRNYQVLRVLSLTVLIPGTGWLPVLPVQFSMVTLMPAFWLAALMHIPDRLPSVTDVDLEASRWPSSLKLHCWV